LHALGVLNGITRRLTAAEQALRLQLFVKIYDLLAKGKLLLLIMAPQGGATTLLNQIYRITM
jgi:stage III sporulation protein SpoIIIAA